jgi:CRP-like cAMP-binding protein
MEPVDASGLFEALDPEHIAGLAQACRIERFAPGDNVVRSGEPADRWYVIDEGMAAVSHVDLTGQPVHVAVLGPGQTFGESALVVGTPTPRTATVSALTDLVVRSLTREEFQVLIRDASLGERLSRRLDLMAVDLALKRASPFASLPPETLWSLPRRLRPATSRPAKSLSKRVHLATRSSWCASAGCK